MHSDDPAAPGPSAGGAFPALGGLAAGQAVGGGRYVLTQVLGQGGMGVVWLARDQRLGEWLALKFLPPEVRHDAVALDDMRRETLKSRRLTHPNIVRIHDFHEAPGEAPFISMEYVDGDNLSNLRLAQPARVFSWDYLAPLVRQLCEALHYAHEEKIIHRDLKPSNLMLDGRGRLKLADFGIAATVSDSMSRVSVAKTSGTVTYMSPQQLDGRTPKVADDIYALGATLYEFLTGKPPFYSGDIPHQVRTFTPDPIEQRLSDFDVANEVPPAVAAMVMACLAKDPEQRPPSARAVAEWIGLTLSTPGTASSREAVAPAPPVSVAEAAPVAAVESVEAAAGTTTGTGRATWVPVTLALAVVAVGLIAGGAFVYWKWLRPKGNETTPVAVSPPVDKPPPVKPVVDAPAPPVVTDVGFTALFNGRDLTGWKGDARYWSVQNGVLVGQKPGSRDKRNEVLFWAGGAVEDFELRFHYRFTSGNSGVYYRAKELAGPDVGGYQFEIWSDKVGNLIETGDDRPRRDLSRRGQRTIAQMLDGKTRLLISGPAEARLADVNAALKQGGWMEASITAQGNRLIHRVNGRTVADVTDEYPARPRAGVLGLELYSQPSEATRIEFRVLQLKRLAPGAAIGWIPLFDGGSLGGWTTPDKATWTPLPDGSIRASGSKGHLFSPLTYTNLMLKAQVKLAPRANGGLVVRAARKTFPSRGYEVDANAHFNRFFTGTLWLTDSFGVNWDALQPVKENWIKEETWFDVLVVAVGNRILARVNDRWVMDYTDANEFCRAGHIALQHVDPPEVHYRNVMAKPLVADARTALAEVAKDFPDLPGMP